MGALALAVKCPVKFASTLLIITLEVEMLKKLSPEVTSAAVWVKDTIELMTSVVGYPLNGGLVNNMTGIANHGCILLFIHFRALFLS